MKDSTLVKLKRCLNQDEIHEAYHGPFVRMEVAMATPFYSKRRRARTRRTDVMMALMTEDELNDLRTILSIGRIQRYGMGKYAPKVDDLAAWRSYLRMEKLTAKDSLKELRKMSTARILEYLNSYLKVRPMSQTRRNLINMLSRN